MNGGDNGHGSCHEHGGEIIELAMLSFWLVISSYFVSSCVLVLLCCSTVLLVSICITTKSDNG